MSPLPERVVVLANPASGRGRGALALEEALAALAQRGIRAEAWPTGSPGQAVALGQRAGDEAVELLVVLGGDGTLRDAVAGLCAADALDRVPVLLVPAGTGNDLARTLAIPRLPGPAVLAGLDGRETRLDLWAWNGVPFVNVAGAGLDAAVAATANERFHHLRGTLAYLAAFAVTVARFRPMRMRLEWPDGGWKGEAWVAAFANGRCYGGGMQIAPAAVPDDGLLDVVVIGDLPRLELLREFPGIFAGRHVLHPKVHQFRVPRVRIEAPPQPATIDGELIGATPAEIRLLPGRLRIRVPAPAADVPAGNGLARE